MTSKALDAIAIGLNDIDRSRSKTKDVLVVPEHKLSAKLPGPVDRVIASPGFGPRWKALDEQHSLRGLQ
jgi:hypothetical protein